jgi:glycosyltransferase involved in cell wall biosynthesis
MGMISINISIHMTQYISNPGWTLKKVSNFENSWPKKSQKRKGKKNKPGSALVSRIIIYIRHLFYFTQLPQEKLLGPLGSKRSGKIVFLFGDEFNPAPSFGNMKFYYLLNEMKRRGMAITWLRVNSSHRESSKGDVRFDTIKLKAPKLLSLMELFVRLIQYCLRNKITIVYFDEWLYFRNRPNLRFLTVLALKLAGARPIVDRRDPYLDFQVAQGKISEHSMRAVFIRLQERLMIRLSTLTILSSAAYQRLLVDEGHPPCKLIGVFRGVDTTKFSPTVDGKQVRSALNVEDKFVIGWFGMMHKHRLIEEVLLPLAKKASNLWPDAHIIIGGKGPLKKSVVEFLKSNPNAPLSYVGLIPYEELPKYIAACDVTLCPVQTNSRFSLHSNWLKIVESLAVGTPVIATRTKTSIMDMKKLRGVVWTGKTLDDFVHSIDSVRKDKLHWKSEALLQADRMAEYSVSYNIPRLVDLICKNGT